MPSFEGPYQSPLLAARKGRLAAVRALLRRGANVNGRIHYTDSSGPDDGRTALIFAAESGHAAVVKSLLRSGADARIKSKEGFSALDAAIKSGDVQTIKLLQKHSVQ